MLPEILGHQKHTLFVRVFEKCQTIRSKGMNSNIIGLKKSTEATKQITRKVLLKKRTMNDGYWLISLTFVLKVIASLPPSSLWRRLFETIFC